MLDGRDAPALLFAALQCRQLLLRVHRVEVQRTGAIPGGIDRVEHRVDILLISHTVKLAAPTDKNRRPETTETTVAQMISLCVFDIHNLSGREPPGRRHRNRTRPASRFRAWPELAFRPHASSRALGVACPNHP